MISKKIIILILILAVITVISGCGKNEVKPVANDDKQIVNQEKNDKQKIENQEEQKQEIEKIATTTDKVDISDWQTYRNEEYGYTLNYPNNWMCNSRFNSYTNVNIGHICKNEVGENIIYSIATKSDEELMEFVKKSGWVVGVEKLLPANYNFNILDSKGIIIEQKSMIFLQHNNLILYIYGSYDINNKINNKVIKSITFN